MDPRYIARLGAVSQDAQVVTATVLGPDHPGKQVDVPLAQLPSHPSPSAPADTWLDWARSTGVSFNLKKGAPVGLREHPNIKLGTTYVWAAQVPAAIQSPAALEAHLSDNYVYWPNGIDESSGKLWVIADLTCFSGVHIQASGQKRRVKAQMARVGITPVSESAVIRDDPGAFILAAALSGSVRDARPSVPAAATDDPPTDPAPMAANVLGQASAAAGGDPAPDAAILMDQWDRLYADFCAFVRGRGYTFAADDLTLFFIAVASGHLTILAGPSGTGKSTLLKLWARFLGTSPESRTMAWMMVEPSWVRSQSLLGEYDPHFRVFRPAANGLADVLAHAADDPGPHVVCLDEMNLARPEFYLAPLLSLLDHPDLGTGWPLYHRSLHHECLNGEAYPPEVPMGQNLMWIGTINLDEASHTPTEKLLDRAVLVTVATPDLQVAADFEPSAPPAPLSAWPAYRAAAPLLEDERRYLDELRQICQPVLFSWRAVESAQRMAAAVPRTPAGLPVWGPETLWDCIIRSRVISKFMGAGDRVLSLGDVENSLAEKLRHSPWGPLERSCQTLAHIVEDAKRHEYWV